jgi:hypothetical protein
MPTFEPPTVEEGSTDPFFGRFPTTVGQTVIKVDGTYTTRPYPWLGELDGLVEGVDYFLGGHVYTVSQTIADALAADGYTTT